MTPCGTAHVLMCSASVRRLSLLHTLHCSRPTLYMSALQRPSCCAHPLSSNTELMVFIPLGVLDKLPLSPRTERILRRVRALKKELTGWGFRHALLGYKFNREASASFVWCVCRFSSLLRFGAHVGRMPFGEVEQQQFSSWVASRDRTAGASSLLSHPLSVYLFSFSISFFLCQSPPLPFPRLSVISPEAQVAWHVL